MNQTKLLIMKILLKCARNTSLTPLPRLDAANSHHSFQPIIIIMHEGEPMVQTILKVNTSYCCHSPIHSFI